MELKRKSSFSNSSSCRSLSVEIDAASLKLENDILKEEFGRIKVKNEKLQKNKDERLFELEKLSKLSTLRQDSIYKLKETLHALNRQKNLGEPIKCKYKWKCWWSKLCKFDHSYLYRKINTNKVNAEGTKPETKHGSENQCEHCNITFKTRKKWKKHVNRVQSNKCDFYKKHFVFRTDLQEHLEQDHNKTEVGKEFNVTEIQPKSPATNCAVSFKKFLGEIKLEEHIEAEHNKQENGTITDDRIDKNNTTFAETGDEEIYIGSTEFKCEICKINFEQKKDLEDHLNKIHLAEIECVFCKIEFNCISDMDNHMDLKQKECGS